MAGAKATNYRRKCDCDVQGDIESDVPEYGIQEPAKQDGEDAAEMAIA